MKNPTATLFAILLLSLSGCASYNSAVPEWAQIGTENSESTASSSESDEEEQLPWWNPSSWF